MIKIPNLISQSKTIILEPGLSVEFIICSSEKSISVIENANYCLLECITPVKVTYNDNRVRIHRQFMVSTKQSCTVETSLRRSRLKFIKFSFSPGWLNTNRLTKYFENNTHPSSFSSLPLFFNFEVLKLFEASSDENTTHLQPSIFALKCLLWNFLSNYLDALQDPERTTDSKLKLEWVTENYFTNFEHPLPSITEISRQLNISRSKFYQLFKEQYGTSFYQYYQSKRMAKSYEWLQSGNFNVTSVSKKLGYSHPIKFINQFKKQFGQTPLKYLKSEQIK